MAPEFTRINIFRDDYRWMFAKFNEGETRPAQGVLANRARDHILKLEEELEAINKVLQENVK